MSQRFKLPKPIHIDRIGYYSSYAYDEAQMLAALDTATTAAYAEGRKDEREHWEPLRAAAQELAKLLSRPPK